MAPKILNEYSKQLPKRYSRKRISFASRKFPIFQAGIIALLQILFIPMGRAVNSAPDAQSSFGGLSDEFLDGYFAARPSLAVSLGLHKYDGRLSDLSAPAIAAENKRLHDFQNKLQALPPSTSLAEAMDRRVLALCIGTELFQFEVSNVFEKNPMTYCEAFDANIYLKRNFAPLPDRLRSIIAIERQLPELLAAAKANLVKTLPKPMVEMAIEESRGEVDFLAHDLVDALKDVKEAALMAEFDSSNAAAISEFSQYAEWLEKDRLPKADSSFALGRENYVKFLAVSEGIMLPPETILEIGMKELNREQAAFNAAAKAINPDSSAEEVFKEIQKDHPTAEALIPETKNHLEAIRNFVIEHQIVTVPSEVRVTVAEAPSFNRHSFASMDAPGPFEQKGAEAYYYVTPVDAKWTDKQKEEWLSYFNQYSADVIAIHESYPGHYVDFLHQKLAEASKIQKIFPSYARIEGWAHYCEQMVIDEGYGRDGTDAEAKVKAAKYRLAQSDASLERLCRLCVSIQMHCQRMSLEDGAKFFEKNAYLNEKPAAREALRGTFDPGYLFYSLGKLQILKLREDYKRQEGRTYSLKTFNDAICDHGPMPIRYLCELFLTDKNSFDDIL
jgi:uncharacterized protein (DUF885 family)